MAAGTHIQEKEVNDMPITTGVVRASYVNIFQPRASQNGGDPKYSVTLLIPKNDTATINGIYAEIEKAKQEGAQRVFGGSIPPMCKTPIYDGDGVRPSGEPFGEECRGCLVMTASAKQQPVIVDLNLQNIINPADVYSGCYIKANISFFAYNTNGNKGIGCGLNCVQKHEDGEPLTARVSAEEAFGRGNALGTAPGQGWMPGQPMQMPAQGAYPQQPVQYQQPVTYPQQPITYPQQMPGTAPYMQPPAQPVDPITGRPMLMGE